MAGRPPKYSTPDEMQERIDEYFDNLGEKHPTVTGLALALDLTRQSLIDYEGKDEFLDTVKKAKLRVEEYIEQRLYSNSVAGCIFNLKNNFGWKDKQEVDHGVTGGMADLMREIDGRSRGIPG